MARFTNDIFLGLLTFRAVAVPSTPNATFRSCTTRWAAYNGLVSLLKSSEIDLAGELRRMHPERKLKSWKAIQRFKQRRTDARAAVRHSVRRRSESEAAGPSRRGAWERHQADLPDWIL